MSNAKHRGKRCWEPSLQGSDWDVDRPNVADDGFRRPGTQTATALAAHEIRHCSVSGILRHQNRAFTWCLVIGNVLLLTTSVFSQAEIPSTPKRFKDLMDRGAVKFDFVAPRTFDAETHFRIFLNYNYNYKTRRVGGANGQVELVTYTFSHLRVRIENEIRLPRTLVGDGFWDTRLVEHEFEHVRINTDPRVTLLVENVQRRNNQVQVPLESFSAGASKQAISNAIEKRIKENVKVCEDLVQRNNKLLDQITRHGITTLESDPNFFRRLYTKENLQEQEFAALPLVSALLRNRRYVKYQKESYEP